MSKAKEPEVTARARLESAQDPNFIALVAVALKRIALEKLASAKGTARVPLRIIIATDKVDGAVATIVAATAKAPGMNIPDEELAGILDAQWTTIIELTQEG